MAHKDLTSGQIHRIHDQEYATLAAALAVTTASDDVGKVWRITDSDMYLTVKTSGTPGTFLKGNAELKKSSTTNDTPANLYSFTMEDNSRIILEARILAMETDGTNGNGYIIRGLFKREGAGAVQQGATDVVWIEEEDSAWSVAFSISGNDVRVQGTGGAATTNVTWISEVELTHVI